MNTDKLNAELVAVGEKIRVKGWQTVGVYIFVSYMAALDLEPGPLDPRIQYRPSIQATPHRADGSFYGSGRSQEYVSDPWRDVKSLDEAIAKLHEAADSMSTMTDEAARIDSIRGRMTEGERRLLGIR